MGLANKMFSGMVWSALERISVQSVSFVLTIFLARLLTPTEYGTVALLLVFISFSQVFIDSGFSKALIQKQDRTSEDISTVFIFNILIAAVCYILLWFGAPFVASFYEAPLLEILLKVLSISLIFNSLYAIPLTLYTIKLDFKSIARVNFIATLLSGVVAIYLAFEGFGAWALVWQTIIKSVLTAVLMWYKLSWKPSWVFSKKSFNSLFSFGSKLLISSLLNKLVNNFYAFFIAKMSTRDLGYYDRGTRFSDIFYATINAVFENVLLPGLATVQDQRDVLVDHTRRIIKMAALMITPLFFGLAVIAEPLIKVLIGEIWLPAVPIMQLICIARLITIVSGINMNLLYVLGRTDLALKQQYLKITVRVILLILALPYGIVYIAMAELVSTSIHFFINTYHPGKIMQYGAANQLSDMKSILFAGLVMSIVGYFSMYLVSNDILKLVIAITSSALTYYGLVVLFKIEEMNLLKSKLTGLIRAKKK